jgi:hypothetical protein
MKINIRNSQSINTKIDPANWVIFDWYNGVLNADEKIITHNLNAATSLNNQQDKLSALSDSNKSAQLGVAEEFKRVIGTITQ